MAAFLSEARRQIERSTPPEALSQIERRLEEIAARLDQEIARPAPPAMIDPRHFDDLARRIDELRQSLGARPPTVDDSGPSESLMRDLDARIDAIGRTDADAHALQSMTAEISAKLDRLADLEILEIAPRRHPWLPNPFLFTSALDSRALPPVHPAISSKRQPRNRS
jgi:tetrahydromethanopterin S-methyltransferase subunit G